MGEETNEGIKLQFDRRLRLEFQGPKITTDAGLLAVRNLDEVMGITEMAADLIGDKRTGKNIQHLVTQQAGHGRTIHQGTQARPHLYVAVVHEIHIQQGEARPVRAGL